MAYLPQSVNSQDAVRATAAALQIFSSFVPFQTVRDTVFNGTNGFLLGTHTWVIQRAFASLLDVEMTVTFDKELSTLMLLIRKIAHLAIVGSTLSMFAGSSLPPRSKVKDFAQLIGVAIGAAIFFKREGKEGVDTNTTQIKDYRERIENIEERIKSLEVLEGEVESYTTLDEIPKKITLDGKDYDFPILFQETDLEKAKIFFKANLTLFKGQLESDRDMWKDLLSAIEPKESHYRQVSLTAAFVFVGIFPLLTRNFLQSPTFSKIQSLATIAWGASSLLLTLSEGYSVEMMEAKATIKNPSHIDNELNNLPKKNVQKSVPIGVESEGSQVVKGTPKKGIIDRLFENFKDQAEKPEKMRERRGSISTVAIAEKTFTFTSTFGTAKKEISKFFQKVELALKQVVSKEFNQKVISTPEKLVREEIYSTDLPTGLRFSLYVFKRASEEEEGELIRRSLYELKDSLEEMNTEAQKMLHFHQVKLYHAVAFAFATVLPMITKNLPKPFASLSTIAAVACVGFAFYGMSLEGKLRRTGGNALFQVFSFTERV